MKLIWGWLGLTIAVTLIFSSWIFIRPFDYDYLWERYNSSQWRDAFSTRIISDDELYQVAGVELWRGADIFSINPEVPPLAKYIYGASAEILGKPFWASLAWYVLGLLAVYWLARSFVKPAAAAWTTLFLALSPLFFSQITQAMLDLPLAVTLLLHIFAMVKLEADKKRATLWLVVAGITLGMFAAIKVPVLVPLIILADGWWLWRQRKIWQLFPIIVLTGLVYVLSFSAFFLQNNSFLAWLRNEKWTLDFYTSGNVRPFPLNFPITVLTGWYKGWWGDPWRPAIEWTILWPLAIIGFFYKIKEDFKRRSEKVSARWLYLRLICVLIAISFIALPFWARYFLILLPLVTIFFVRWIDSLHQPQRIFIALAAVFSLQALVFFRPTPAPTLLFVRNSWEEGYYQDVYPHVAPTNLDRDTFDATMDELDLSLNAQERRVRFIIPVVWPWQNSSQTEAQVTFYTFDGIKRHSFTVPIVRSNGHWLLLWPQDQLNELRFEYQ